MLGICMQEIDIDGKLSDKIKSNLNTQVPNIEQIKQELNQISTSVSQNFTSNNIESLRLKSVQIKNFKGFKEYGTEDRGCKIDIHKNKTVVLCIE